MQIYFTNTVCRDTYGERISEKTKLVITFLLVTIVFFIGHTPALVSYDIIPSGDGTTDISFYAQLTTVADFIFVVSLCFNPFQGRSQDFSVGTHSFPSHLFTPAPPQKKIKVIFDSRVFYFKSRAQES